MSLGRLAVFFGLAASAAATAVYNPQRQACRNIPGDAGWPSANDWAKLNQTVHGHLISSVPLASVCHDAPFNNYDAGECTAIQGHWNQTTLQHINSPAEFLSMYFNNYTCDAFTPRDRPCELGNFPSYVINVTGPADVQAGVQFAREHNIRLIVKNTGHDYLGKSSGHGSLSLWTHNLKTTQFLSNYTSPQYRGPAMKSGAGVEGFDYYQAVNRTGHRAVGGSCPTVGVAGGYTQGGGHSMLSSMYGMGADNVLEWEVVTLDGRHLIATPERHSDLYWAMSGGGGGTYAVAISMTSRIFVDSIVGGASLTFNDSVVGNEAFWEAITQLHVLLAPFVDGGNSLIYTLAEKEFASWAWTMPGANDARVAELMQPFLADLEQRGIPYHYQPRIAPNFYDHYNFYIGPLPEGFAGYTPFTGSRIIPRHLMTDPERGADVTAVLRNITMTEGYPFLPCQALNVRHQKHPKNAVLPAWRDAMAICLMSGTWDPHASPEEMAARQDVAANVVQPMIDDATPGGGVYLNEANYLQHDWQREFYGDNYDRLVEVKRRWDPDHLLWGYTTVDSERWYQDSEARLCRTDA
ncbi:hypothetical protein CDD81_3699 [Ophiocordyceps australis]|uniref:FAD-binding PCMH-type domain-containing protein n=1 Tax=Ophiocordyceps australis TaxID=1399860 RepID=A0A2C5XWZ9_9HYPO|nr:hypothetical protein CDD81_3699 [Ophiocordyceps australis]